MRAARPARCRDDAAFPLFDLPPEAVELVLRCVGDPGDKRALRLVCKRTCASVDGSVVAVKNLSGRPPIVPGIEQLSVLVRAPWQLLRLELRSCRLDDAGAASLAAACWSSLQEISLVSNNLGPEGAASLAAAHFPALYKLDLGRNSLGDAGVASLAAAHFPALQELDLSSHSAGPAGVASLAAAHFPALRRLAFFYMICAREAQPPWRRTSLPFTC